MESRGRGSAENPCTEGAGRFRWKDRVEYLRYYSIVTYLLSPFFQSDWPVLGWGRDIVLPLLPRVPWVKRQMLLTVTGQKGGFFRGRMTV